MICPFQLVLYEHPGAGSGFFAEKIGSKWSDVLLLRFEFELQTYRLAYESKVVWQSEPGGEITSFLRPHVPDIHSLQPSELVDTHKISSTISAASVTRTSPDNSFGSSASRMAASVADCS